MKGQEVVNLSCFCKMLFHAGALMAGSRTPDLCEKSVSPALQAHNLLLARTKGKERGEFLALQDSVSYF